MGTFSAKQTTAAAQRKKKKEYFFVFRTEVDGKTVYVLQELNDALVPTGNVNTADVSTLNDYFLHEPNILAMPLTKPDFVPPKQRTQRKDQHPEEKPAKEELPKTTEGQELTPSQIKAAEKIIRNNFAEAFKKLDEPVEHRRALRTIKKIAAQKEGIAPEHKHMFRDFSVDLRKKSLPEIALLFAIKNTDLAPDDDHAYFNLARLYLMLDRFNEAINAINRALDTKNISEHDAKIYEQLLEYAQQKMAAQWPVKPE